MRMLSSARKIGVLFVGTFFCIGLGWVGGEYARAVDPEAQEKQIRGLVAKRTEAVATLVRLASEEPRRGVVSAPSQGDARWEAILALGDYRAIEGVEPLLGQIDVLFLQTTEGGRLGKDRIVIESLGKIGKPASRAAVEYLAKNKDKEKQAERARLYVRVIALVEGVDLGKEMVRLAFEKEKDAERKARLKEALGLFKDADKPIP
jgi:hypothetical protein